MLTKLSIIKLREHVINYYFLIFSPDHLACSVKELWWPTSHITPDSYIDTCWTIIPIFVNWLLIMSPEECLSYVQVSKNDCEILPNISRSADTLLQRTYSVNMIWLIGYNVIFSCDARSSLNRNLTSKKQTTSEGVRDIVSSLSYFESQLWWSSELDQNIWNGEKWWQNYTTDSSTRTWPCLRLRCRYCPGPPT